MLAQQLSIAPSEFWRLSFWELGARAAGQMAINGEDAVDASKDSIVEALQSGSF